MSWPDSGKKIYSGSVYLGAAVISLCCLHAAIMAEHAALLSQAFVPPLTLLRFCKVWHTWDLGTALTPLRSSDFPELGTAWRGHAAA